jgi:Leucine-rich repeat (LRR) protein
MRKTTQKKPQKVLKIEKIDFQNGNASGEKAQQISDIRFESSDPKERAYETTPSLKQIINYHQVNKQLYLRFYGYPLEGLPKEVCGLKHLQGLSILHCQLRRLPPYIADLHRLRHLFLINNRLEFLPDELTTMKHLQYLDVSENQLTALPNHFEHLVKLTDFYLDKNLFTAIPTCIAVLNKLIRLGLSGNQLTSLPNIVYEWQKLIRLNLADNRLTDLPESLGKLGRLEWLNLSGNPFPFIPKAILTLPKLELLFLRNCGLNDLPEELALIKTLQVLDLSGNPLYNGRIPKVVFQFPQLEELIMIDCGLQLIDEDDFLPMKHLCIIRLQNNKIRYISRRLARMKQAEEFNFSGNPLEYVAPEMYQLPLLERLILAETPFEEVDIKKDSTEIAQEAVLETYEPVVKDIRLKYGLERRRNFM